MKYFSLVLFGVWVLAEVLSAQELKPDVRMTLAEQLIEAADFRTTQSVRYDPAYVVIDYPNGDVPADTGVCTDVVIRSYRVLGIDLQKRLHEDMKYNFSSYPKNWGLRRPDKNIDHRRVPNLQRYFKRKGAEVAVSEDAEYLPGDLVAWDLNGNGLWHIGVVTGEDEFVHNIGGGPVKDRGIEQWTVVGHYRFHPGK
ncbi:DUF1287 domain-containing protein [Verrucomicrobiales bacterium]|nr:DUF1287 domain-containing protein [Verrucomicrobiales bacterium]|tara:strand:+ start:734 stop:1324 length:591 start_codon:yes stop_codon:yes gene_type:complete